MNPDGSQKCHDVMSFEKCNDDGKDCEQVCPEKKEKAPEDQDFVCWKDESTGEEVRSFKHCEKVDPANDPDGEAKCEQRCPLMPFKCFQECHTDANGEELCHDVMSFEKCDNAGKNCEMICPTQKFVCDTQTFQNTDGTENVVEFWSHEVCDNTGCRQECPPGMGPQEEENDGDDDGED